MFRRFEASKRTPWEARAEMVVAGPVALASWVAFPIFYLTIGWGDAGPYFFNSLLFFIATRRTPSELEDDGRRETARGP